jgi:hypothetical protein
MWVKSVNNTINNMRRHLWGVNLKMKMIYNMYRYRGARRRRSGGGPGEGCARKPVGTYLYLHAVGAGNP